MDSAIYAALITACIGILSLYYTHKMQKISDDKIFIELFQGFNNRYDNIHNLLEEIINKPIECSLTVNEESIIIDYFNFCAEEFYWYYHKKRIDSVIWQTWSSGMRHYYNNEIIKKRWISEIIRYGNGTAYYLPRKSNVNPKNIKFFHEIKKIKGLDNQSGLFLTNFSIVA